MNDLGKRLWRIFNGREKPSSEARPLAAGESLINDLRNTRSLAVDIAPDDPLLTYFQKAPGAVEVDKIGIDSPGLNALKAGGIKMVVPLVSQGELIGLLSLGPRMSEQEYSLDDRTLLNNLAAQAAPAARVAQLVRQQQEEAQSRERLEQQLRVARLIQQTLLPTQVPTLPGWEVGDYYQPAQAVGGDFYDFLYFEDGRLGLVVGDVSDKGVPAALLMATTRSILRTVAQQHVSPGRVLERVNDLLRPDVPPNMFVTCLYAILDPRTGQLTFANAGHCLPIRRHAGGAAELRATGMPLGLMAGMRYDEKTCQLEPHDSVLFYSDGLLEAHNPQREMFGYHRLADIVAGHSGGAELIDVLLSELKEFTGQGWQQEDDVTMVTLQYKGGGSSKEPSEPGAGKKAQPEPAWESLAEFEFASEPGNERTAMEAVAEVVSRHGLQGERLERLKTAVAEATMNAMEHGHKYHAELMVKVALLKSSQGFAVRITDEGGGRPIVAPDSPNIEAKMEGLQSPRGWGLFLIRNMVDEVNITTDETHHTVELVMNFDEGGSHAEPEV